MYGAQTSAALFRILFKFENDVEMYGAQTVFSFIRLPLKFEKVVSKDYLFFVLKPLF